MRQTKLRFTVLDAGILILLAAAAVFLVRRVGGEMDYRWQWPVILPYLVRSEGGGWGAGPLVAGFITTLKLSLWAMALATLLGTGLGLLRAGRGRFGRLTAAGAVETIRNLPPLVLVFIVFFFLGDRIMALIGLEEMVRTAGPGMRAVLELLFAPPARLAGFLAGLAALVLYEAAYIAEIVRAGVQSVEQGQWEAAASLGLTRRQQLRHVVLPQAFRRILPALAGQLISTIKDSAIVSVISVPELTFQGLELVSATYLSFEVWITIAALYFLLTFACSLGVGHLEKAWRH